MERRMMFEWKADRARIDLSNGSIVKEEIGTEELHHYFGARGLNISILQNELPSGIDPLSPDNILCLGTGAFTGSSVPSSGRYNVTTKSPASGMLGDANSGGFWGPELKYSGFTQLVITGKSPKPVYIYIDSNHVSIRDASHLWGQSVWETEKILRKECGDEAVQISSIGQGGENLVPFAAVMNNLSRAAGRTGIGAVMGSKNLKAIAVRGTKAVTVHDSGLLMELNKKLLKLMYESPSFAPRSTFGTSMLVELYNKMGVLPTKNLQSTVYEDADKISGQVLIDKYVVKPKACFGCPVHCSHYYKIESGPYAGTEGEGPEFETMCAFGSRCGNNNLEAILAANNLCNQYGLDTISTGGVIAFAMECWEKNFLTEKDTGGIDLSWGNHESMLDLIHKIAFREGFGKQLAQGVAALSRQIPGSEDFALHIKGVETPQQGIRGLKSWGLGWAVSSRGADHCRAFPLAETTWTPEEAEKLFGTPKAADRFSYDGKPEMVKWYEEYSAMGDAMGMCRIAQLGLNMPLDLLAEITYAVTGLDFGEQGIMEIGERIVQTERVFNLQHGLDPTDDRLPTRYVKEKVAAGPSAGETYDLEGVLKRYYDLRQWDRKTGWPAETVLKRLGIEFKKNGKKEH